MACSRCVGDGVLSDIVSCGGQSGKTCQLKDLPAEDLPCGHTPATETGTLVDTGSRARGKSSGRSNNGTGGSKGVLVKRTIPLKEPFFHFLDCWGHIFSEAKAVDAADIRFVVDSHSFKYGLGLMILIFLGFVKVEHWETVVDS